MARRIEALVRRGRAGLAWEVTRRDPAYRADWERAEAADNLPAGRGDRPLVSRKAALARQWGLHFCRKSRGGFYAGGAGLVCRPGSVRPARPDRSWAGECVLSL
ncbi:transcriptional regulator domain-containing protein [Sphingobium yanoikuyae]